MFNMNHVGRTISELRKSHNMTQMELADKMNISFQAISNWERGQSMPDVSKLPELAELFGVTIDRLLGEKAELLKNIAYDNTGEYLKNNDVSAEELKQIAPLLKPEQTDMIFDNAAQSFAIYEIVDLLPFLSCDLINKLALSRYEKDGLASLDALLPFIPDPTLEHIAEVEFEKHGLRYFHSIAPFLDDPFLNKLAKKVIQKEGVKAILPLAPFIDDDVLSGYIQEKYL